MPVALYPHKILNSLYKQSLLLSPASPDRLDSYRKTQAEDSICSKLIEYCSSGWPNRNRLSRELKDYWRFRGELTLSGTLLLYQSRIVIPLSLRQATLEKIHHGHQGILSCRMRVSTSVWWPGVSKEMENFIKSCPIRGVARIT